METKVLKIDWQPDKDGNTWLHLLIEDGFLGRKFAAENAERPLRVKLVRWQEKRSLDANAYCFVLIGKIAEKTGVPKDEVYREAVRNLGGNYDTVCIQNKAADALCEGWSHNGLGWIAERFPSKIDGCVNVNLYNNNADNLEWVTQLENMQYASRLGRMKYTDRHKKNLRASLIKNMGKPVVAVPTDGGDIIRFSSVNATAEHGFQPSCVSNCCNGIRDSHKGYYWRFADEKQKNESS